MKSVIILGGGYSVKSEGGLEKGLWDKIKGKEVWSLNFAFKFMPFLPSRQIWVDDSFFKNEIENIQRLAENKVPLYAKEHVIYSNFIDIKQHSVFRTPSEDREDKYFSGQMGLVGLFALSLAVKENYDTIYLLGYDYGVPVSTDLNTHWYIEEAVDKKIESSGLRMPEVYMEKINVPKSNVTDFAYYSKFNKKIYNVSMRSNISYFDKITYDQFFEKIKEG